MQVLGRLRTGMAPGKLPPLLGRSKKIMSNLSYTVSTIEEYSHEKHESITQ